MEMLVKRKKYNKIINKQEKIDEIISEEKTATLAKPKLIINKDKFIEMLKKISIINDFHLFKVKLLELKSNLKSTKDDLIGILNIDSDGDSIKVSKEYILNEIQQIEKTITIERAKYYLKRLIKALTEIKTGKINDINFNTWKEYKEILTDSLWIFDKRDNSGAHIASYWGNFIPQIPHQTMLRYTKKNDWILDTFVGSGTTLIECRRLGRNGIGIELNADVARKAKELIEKEYNKYKVITEIITGDSRVIDLKQILDKYGITKIQHIIMHPPYYDIIKFSNDKRDLSNAKNIKEFLNMFGEVIDNVSPFLEKGRYFTLVIGDKYSKGEWIPLGFYCMEEVLKRNFILKSIIVKNFEETRGKRNQQELWRYRALVGGFYIFKHEYVMIFKKR